MIKVSTMSLHVACSGLQSLMLPIISYYRQLRQDTQEETSHDFLCTSFLKHGVQGKEYLGT